MQRWLAMISGLRRLTAAREQSTSRLQPNGYLASALLALLPDAALTNAIALPGSDDPSGAFTVSLPGTSYPLVRLAISYARDQRYPVLLLRTPSQSAYDRRPQQRSNWLQKALPSYDVDLYTYSRWKKGTVHTRSITAPLIIEGQQLHVTLSAGTGGSLLETAVYDEWDCCLVRCIHPVEQHLERA